MQDTVRSPHACKATIIAGGGGSGAEIGPAGTCVASSDSEGGHDCSKAVIPSASNASVVLVVRLPVCATRTESS